MSRRRNHGWQQSLTTCTGNIIITLHYLFISSWSTCVKVLSCQRLGLIQSFQQLSLSEKLVGFEYWHLLCTYTMMMMMWLMLYYYYGITTCTCTTYCTARVCMNVFQANSGERFRYNCDDWLTRVFILPLYYQFRILYAGKDKISLSKEDEFL